MAIPFEADLDFASHFRNLHQVFMYITDRCNLECEQCIYKPSISHFINEEIPLPTAAALLQTFYNMGARKATFLGGEPTLYGHRENGRPLLELISCTKDMGFEYVRLDTNGQRISRLLANADFGRLDEIAFSLDGFSAETNDPLRGVNTFERAVRGIKEAISLGYHVTITCCVQRLFLERNESGVLKIEQMISFGESLGVAQINFHDLFKVGIPMDTWTGDFAPAVQDWPAVYEELRAKIKAGVFGIAVRLPMCFVERTEFERNPEFYGYCPVKLGERVMVHPNGVIRICSNLICTGFGVARFNSGKIEWDSSNNNEMSGHDLNSLTPCTNRSRHRKYGKLVPVCFSFKPDQEEYVWQHRLNWDSHRKITA